MSYKNILRGAIDEVQSRKRTYTTQQLSAFQSGLSSQLDKPVEKIAPLLDGSIEYAVKDSSGKLKYGRMDRFTAMEVIQRGEKELEYAKKRDEWLKKPTDVFTKFCPVLYGIDPLKIQVEKEGSSEYFVITPKDSVLNVKIPVETAKRDILDYRAKLERIAGMDVRLRRTDILQIDVQPLYSPKVNIEEIKRAEQMLDKALQIVHGYLIEADTPDKMAHGRGRYTVDETGKVDLELEILPFVDDSPIRSSADLNSRNVADRRTFKSLNEFLSEV